MRDPHYGQVCSSSSLHKFSLLVWKQQNLLSKWVCLSQLKPSGFYILSSKVYTTFLAGLLDGWLWLAGRLAGWLAG